jgi:hypothetical protein
MPNTLDKILNMKLKDMKNWSTYDSHSKINFRNKIRQILSLLSGDDVIGMLCDVLSENEKNQISAPIYNALSNLSFIYNNKKPISKYQIAFAFRKAKLSLNESISLGFNISERLWSKAKYTQIEAKRGPKRKINEDLKSLIKNHLEKISSPSSNRSIKVKNKGLVNVRYLNCSFKESYRSFEYKNIISLSSFLSFIPPEFKKPHRLTDLCNYCEYKRDIINNLKNLADLNDFNSMEFFQESNISNLDIVKNFFNCDKRTDECKTQAMKMLKQLNIIDFHRKIAETQREAYNKMRKDKSLLREAILIDFDFKQKIVIGISPRQTNDEYYKQKLRSLLGNFFEYSYY